MGTGEQRRSWTLAAAEAAFARSSEVFHEHDFVLQAWAFNMADRPILLIETAETLRRERQRVQPGTAKGVSFGVGVELFPGKRTGSHWSGPMRSRVLSDGCGGWI
jgi:hypothetical protein